MPNANSISDYIMIKAKYTDENGDNTMDYTIHLKKWGADWDDFGTYPPQYEWYKNIKDSGQSMPDTLPN